MCYNIYVNKRNEVNEMRATGIIRRIDDLGRVVIPREIRKSMNIREGEPLEIYTDRGGCVIFKKYQNDNLAPIGESIVATLRANGITASVYNSDGDRVAGFGSPCVKVEELDEVAITIRDTDFDGISHGYILTDKELSDQGREMVKLLAQMASSYLS
jgi:AbrB family looped-hinge helix DNA binding protein